LTFTIVAAPAKGSVTLTNASTGAFNYVPAQNVTGADNFAFAANDGRVDSNVATVTVTIDPVNDPPTIGGTPPTVAQPGALYDFTPIAGDVDGDVLGFSIVNQPLWADFDPASGRLFGTPGPGDVGTTTAVTITASDTSESVSLPPFDLVVPPDDGAPVTTASLAAGVYATDQTVNLTCQDFEGDACAIFFSFDALATRAEFTAYTDALTLTDTVTLRFFARDTSDNEESTRSLDVVIDKVAPSITIVEPADAAQLEELFWVSGTTFDQGSGVAAVEVQISDGTQYLTPTGVSSVPVWLSAVDLEGGEWIVFTTGFAFTLDTTYSITARATDEAGHQTSDSVLVLFSDEDPVQAFTRLTLELSAANLLPDQTLDVTGKLTRLPDTGVSLAGRTLELEVSDGDGVVTEHIVTETRNAFGQFRVDDVGGFVGKGTFTVTVTFESTDFLAQSQASAPVQVSAGAGYAVLVQGSDAGGTGLDAHRLSADRIYQRLLARGFTAEDVRYLGDNAAAPGVDALASAAGVQDAIETWALTKLDAAPAPLHVILVGPGAPNTFFLGAETLSAADLAAWLDTLEGMLDDDALDEPRVVVVAANQSGSFIPPLSKLGRMVIASTSGDAEAYQGPLEADGTEERASELFLEELYTRLAEGRSFAEGFDGAAARMRRVTRRGGPAVDTGPDPDAPMQRPRLDDDGDGVGSEALGEVGGDGEVAAVQYLGVASSTEQAPRLTAVTGTLHLAAEQTSALLWATTSAPVATSGVWMALRRPSHVVIASGSTVQSVVGLAREPFDGLVPETGRFERTFEGFDESGTYAFYYFLRESPEQGLAPLARSVVYKNRAGNRPPGPFELRLPAEGATRESTLVLDWSDATDPEGDALTYTLLIATDADFTNVVHRAGELTQSLAIVDERAGLADLTRHYWKVEAVDAFGATRASVVRFFDTDNTNGFPGFISGVVQSALDATPIAAVTVSTEHADLTLTDPSGHYAISTNAQPTDVRADKSGFVQGLAAQVEVPSAGNVEVNFALAPAGGADLSVTQQAPSAATVDTDLTYAVTVANHGPAEANNVVVSDALPAGLALKSVTPDVCTEGAGTLACFVGDLAATQQVRLTITATATAAGMVAHTVNVTADGADPVTTNNAATAETEVVDAPVPDTDGDGIDDDVERANGLDPLDPSDAAADRDGDGLSNLAELALGTDMNDADTDGDGIDDGDDPRPLVHANVPAVITIIIQMMSE
ncbi:MAG: Ig-like domain-containing protein, partial [Candidatus Binatia bacterium]